MPSVIGYAVDADNYCPRCAREYHGHTGQGPQDEHGIPEDATGREGNPLAPIFSTGEVLQDIHCSACGDEIALAYWE